MGTRQLTIAGLTAVLLGLGPASAGAGANDTARREAVTGAAGAVAYVLMARSNSVAVIDLEQRAVVGRIAVGGNPHGGTLTPDGAYLYTASMGANNIHVVDTRARSVVDTIDIGSITHHSVASPDGRYIYTAADQVVVIDTTDNRIVARIATEDPPFYLTFAPDGERLYALGMGSSIAVIDPKANRTIATIPLTEPSRMGHMAIRPGGRELYVTSDVSNTVSVIDVAARQEVARFPVGKAPHGITATGDGGRMIVGNRGQTDLSVIDTATRKIVATRDIGPRPEHLTASPDGRFLLVSRNTGSNQVLMLDPVSLETVAAIDVWEAPHVILVAGRALNEPAAANRDR